MQRLRKTILGSLLTAVTVALGFSLAGVPNVELMTLTVFVSGYLLGATSGALIGGASIALHSIFNPLGAALPPLLAAQVFGFAVVGACGGWFGPWIANGHRIFTVLAAAGFGLVLTLLYDILTNVGAFLTITGERGKTDLVQFVVAGLAFTIMHVVWNTGVFLVALRPTLRVLSRQRDELG
jgi:hypothetical protein